VIARLFAGLLLAGLLTAAAPSVAAAQCNAALVLGLDVSSSVDEDEYALQVNGLAAALASPEVSQAILGGPGSGIMAVAFAWSGAWQQTIMVDWTWLGDYPAIARFARRLQTAQRGIENWPTAMGRATEFAARLHRRNPVDCTRQLIDISGDGVNNDGAGPDWYAKRGAFEGLTINGMVILGADPDPSSYYRDKLIHGPGAFVEIADSYRDYRQAIQRKLLRELRPAVVMGAS
jgi:hypothetical protein